MQRVAAWLGARKHSNTTSTTLDPASFFKERCPCLGNAETVDMSGAPANPQAPRELQQHAVHIFDTPPS